VRAIRPWLNLTLGADWAWATPETSSDLSQQDLMYDRSVQAP
jgi:hypothetical protein